MNNYLFPIKIMNKTFVRTGSAIAIVALAACSTTTDTDTGISASTSISSQASSAVGVEVGGAMMLPSLDIVDNAANANNLTTLVAAVQAADLVATLKSDGPFTVFAPVNSAFDALPDGTVETLLLPENKAQLASILTYHVVPGRYTSERLRDGMKLTTVQGEDITISYNGTKWMVNNAEVLVADIISSNGVSYGIDAVIMPGDVMDDDEMMDDDAMMDDEEMMDDDKMGQ